MVGAEGPRSVRPFYTSWMTDRGIHCSLTASEEDLLGETSWLFLLIGSFAAVGAAMVVGTLAALLRYHRTGQMPGAEVGAEVPAGRVAALWARVGVGIVLTVAGVVALDRSGVLTL